MKNLSLFKCITALFVTFFVFVFTPFQLVAQNDVLDKFLGVEVDNCVIRGEMFYQTIEITIDFDGDGNDTLVIIDNLMGASKLHDDVSTGDYVYYFCGPNVHFCAGYTPADGEFLIRFQSPAGTDIGVNKISFNIDAPGVGYTITYYQDTDNNGTGEATNNSYSSDQLISFEDCDYTYDSIIIAPDYDLGIDGSTYPLFNLNNLVIENIVPAAPTAAASQDFCGYATIADLSASAPSGSTLSWYASASGGTALIGTDALSNGSSYYAQSNNTASGCMSALRTAVVVSINTPPAPPSLTSPQNYCGSATVGDLNATPPGGSTMLWYANASGGAALSASAALSNGTTYYAESENTTTGCASATRAPVTVAINTLPSSPSAAASQSFCGSATVADLSASLPSGSTLSWYAAVTGGSALAGSAALSNGTSYYAQAENTSTSCISLSRTEVVVTINSTLAAPGAASPQNFCGSATLADLTAGPPVGATVNWYAASTGGTPLAGSTVLIDGTSYYAEAENTSTSCVSASRTEVVVAITATLAAPGASSPQNFCGSATIADLVASPPGGATVNWYSASTGGIPLATLTALSNGTSYYAESASSGSGCVSTSRTVVLVAITATLAAPVASSPQNFCASATIADLVATSPAGATVNWYSASTGGTPLAGSTALSDGTSYYAESASSGSSCVSNSRTTVSVAIHLLPDAPTATSNQSFCGSATIANLSASATAGSIIVWYAASAGGTALAGTNVLSDASTYYAASENTTTGCVSATRALVSVTINTLPAAPSLTSPQNLCNGSSISDLSAIAPPGSNVVWYAAAIGGSPISDLTSLNNGSTYYAGSVNAANGCESASRVPLSVNLSTCYPEVVCVLDISGSMKRDYEGNYGSPQEEWRIQYAKEALLAFVELLTTNFGTDNIQFALVSFNAPGANVCNAYTDYLMNNLTAASYNIVEPIILNLNASGGTPLLAGLETAKDLFKTINENNEKVIVLLSDGAHNCPSLPNITASAEYTTLMSEINEKNIKVYTIGFGSSGEVDHTLLSDIASASSGDFYDVTNGADDDIKTELDPTVTAADVWDAGNALDIAYSHVLNDGLNLGYTHDPMAVINLGETKEYEIPVSGLESKICFFVSWTASQTNYLGLKIKTSDGNYLPAVQPGITYSHRKSYSIITVSGRFLNRPGIMGLKPWILEVSGSNISNDSEKFQYMVLNQSSKLKFKVWFDKPRYFAGDIMKVYLEIKDKDQTIKALDEIKLKANMPEEGLGNFLTRVNISKEQFKQIEQKELERITAYEVDKNNTNAVKQVDASVNNKYEVLDRMSFTALKLKAIKEFTKTEIPGRLKLTDMYFNDRGNNGDSIAGDGIYTATYRNLTKEGSYKFNVTAIDRSKGSNIKRESMIQKYVRVKISPKDFVRSIEAVDTILKGKKIYNVYLNLHDEFGNKPSPNALKNIKLSLNKGELVGIVQANPDGTFSQRIVLAEKDQLKNVILTMEVYGQTGEQQLPAGFDWKYIWLVILLLLLVIIVWVRRRK